MLSGVGWPCGLMDKASASGAGDCGFESHQGRFFLFSIHFVCFSLGVCLEFWTPLVLSLNLTTNLGSQTINTRNKVGAIWDSTLDNS